MNNPNYTDHQFHILAWNANGILSDLYEFKHFMTSYNFDIALISETHLKPCISLSLPNYRFYRKDRLHMRGGGVAIFIKQSIPHHLLSTIDSSTLEILAINASLPNGQNITIGAAYNPPQFLPDANALLNFFSNTPPSILAGDLNCKHSSWHSRRCNKNGNFLLNFASQHNLTISAPCNPTFFPTGRGSPDVLDIAITKNFPFLSSIHTLNALSSDHQPISLELDCTASPSEIQKKSVCWDKFKHFLQNQPPIQIPGDDPVSLENSVTNFTKSISDAIESSTKIITFKNSKSKLSPWFREQIREKKRFRRIWHRTGDPAAKTTYNRLRHQLSRELRRSANEKWENLLQEASTQDNSIWRLNKFCKKSDSAIPPIHGLRGIVYSDPDKANAFAETYEEQFSPHSDLHDFTASVRIHNEIQRFLNFAENHSTNDFTTKEEEISDAIKSFKNTKAPGHDKIPNEALKSLPPAAILNLAILFNSLLRNCYFPSSWKNAIITVFKKPN